MNPGTDGDAIVLGVDIGGTKTSLLALTVASGRRVATTTAPTPCDAGPAAFVAFLRRESDAMLDRAGVDPRRVKAVGCAVPGQVDAHGLVLGAGNLEGWSHVPLREWIEAEWRVPAFVEQDANAGALGEMWRGSAQAMTDFVFLALGTGLGAGIVIDRRVHRGAHHAAGEVGDLVLDRRALGRGEHQLTARIGSRALRARALEATGSDVLAADVLSGAPSDARLAPIARDMVGDLSVACDRDRGRPRPRGHRVRWRDGRRERGAARPGARAGDA